MRHFLQSADWADFHKSLGSKIIKHQSKNGDFIAFIEKSHGKLGKHLTRLYIPYGPFVDSEKQLSDILSEAEEMATQNNADYIRVEPIGIADIATIMKSLGYVKRHKPSQPEQTSILDISGKSEEEVVAMMSPSIRNRWRANKNTGRLTFEVSYESSRSAPLIDMLQKTAERLGLVFHDGDYTRKMVEVLGERKACGIAYALKDGKELAGTQFVVDRPAKTLYYLHAGSYVEARDFDVASLLLSYLIILASNYELDSVDLFGVAPKDAAKDHPYAGFSSFKRAFGGSDVEYNGTWEKGLKLKYNLIKKFK